MNDITSTLLMFALMGAALYFLMIRPQQRKAKEHRDMLKNLRRGDVVVMQGGLIGKIVKVVDENELLLIERWESAAHQRVHMEQPHMARLREIKDKYIADTRLGRVRLED